MHTHTQNRAVDKMTVHKKIWRLNSTYTENGSSGTSSWIHFDKMIKKSNEASAIQEKNQVNIFCMWCVCVFSPTIMCDAASLTFSPFTFYRVKCYLEPNDQYIYDYYYYYIAMKALMFCCSFCCRPNVMMSKFLKHNSCFTHVTDQHFAGFLFGHVVSLAGKSPSLRKISGQKFR